MPLASSRSSTESKAASDRRRLSLPATIDSSTRVTTRSKRAIDRRRASLQRSNSGNSKSNKRPLEDPSSPQHKGNAVDKENNAGAASPGVTPYWMVRFQNESVVSAVSRRLNCSLKFTCRLFTTGGSRTWRFSSIDAVGFKEK